MSNSPIDRDPATLVWVGSTMHPEFIDAFRYCRDHVAQLAVRRTPQELLNRPAGFVKRIIFARVDRQPLPKAVHASIIERYGDAGNDGTLYLTLSSMLCDGETRTGEPWTMPNIRFSRWRDVIPTWLEPCGHRGTVLCNSGAILVICDRYEMAEPYLDWASSLGRATIWSRTQNLSAARNISNVIWDDSIALPVTTDGWRKRVSGGSPIHHTWLTTQPHAAEIKAAIEGGVSQVFTKPVTMNSLFAGIGEKTYRLSTLPTKRINAV